MRLVSTRTHAMIDHVVRIAIAASPWHFGFAWVPHLLLGAFWVTTSFSTRTTPGTTSLTSQA